MNNHVHVLQFLKDHLSLTIADATYNNNELLQCAAEQGSLEAVKFLKDWGILETSGCVPVGIKPSGYAGAFINAARRGHLHVLRFFKEQCNFNPEWVTCIDGRCLARAVAEGNKHAHVVQFLEEWLGPDAFYW